MYKRPDLSHSKITELFQTHQKSDESTEGFMDRLHGIAQLGFRHLPEDEKQEILVTAFCKGLHDRVSARLVATQAHGRVAEAVRIASAALSFDQGEKFSYSQTQNHSHPPDSRHERVVYAGTRDAAEQLDPQDHYPDEFVADFYNEDEEFENANYDESLEDSDLVGPQGGRFNNYPGRGRGFRGFRRGYNRFPGRSRGELQRGSDTSRAAGITCHRCGGLGHMVRDCGTASDFQNSSVQRTFEPRVINRDSQRRPNESQQPEERLCYLCGKPGHFAASCPKSEDNQATETSNVDPQSVSARTKPVPIDSARKPGRKQLISALAAELGVAEFSLVIQEFQPPPRPLLDECASSSSGESTCDQFNDSACLNLSAFEHVNSNFVNSTFSKLCGDSQVLRPFSSSSVDIQTVLSLLSQPTGGLSVEISNSPTLHDLIGFRTYDLEDAEIPSTGPHSTVLSAPIPQALAAAGSVPFPTPTGPPALAALSTVQTAVPLASAGLASTGISIPFTPAASALL